MINTVIDPNIRFGKPVIRGTRVAVADIIGLLKAGYALEEIPEQYPELKMKDVLEALDFSVDLLANPAKILQHVTGLTI
ncbi:DUF433 domain-containing protein [Patescibacteria group bacterium]|nr:DUF433 domain-containing protein [Patescibacteria group bacterium]MCG2701877.1 DUF433 domain-containing protein [Candidatus Parcubacteria bacterium]MBU4264446.1 DUF433 domain-containing protein [Patescibacteria group bacterium]MBU4390210.1 DUF433 domain-containing protein [Patescibacteria group bacterium]MBU4397212.1 DUF433 domain-containing protein [Patescibacteria group bacterium]